jgi:hypothetical protein
MNPNEPLGKTSVTRTLWIVAAAEGRIKPTHAADAQDIPLRKAERNLNKLHTSGLVGKVRDPEGRDWGYEYYLWIPESDD